MAPRRARQRSLRKTRAASDDDDDQDASQVQPVAQAADIIAARRQKKKEARKQALLGGNTAGGGGNANVNASVDIMGGRTTEEYSSIAKMNAMAKELNVTISGSFRKETGQVDDGRISMGFHKDGAGYGGMGAGAVGEMEVVKSDVANDAIDANDAKGAEAMGGGYAIPDEATIRRARQRREMLRSGEPDFIPTEIPAGKSNHVSFDVDGDQERDESSFAREQIEKGMRTMAARKHAPGTPALDSSLDLKSLDAETLADDILNKLTMQLERVTTTLKQHEHGIARTLENLTDTTKKLFEDEKMLEDLGDEFEKAQEMRGYVRALCSMLHEKSPILEELQHQSLQCRIEYSRAVSGASQQKSKELIISASKGVDAAMKVLLGGGSQSDATLAAARAVTEAEASLKSGEHIPVELDEFGRDMNMEKRMMARKGSPIEDIIGKADRAFSTRQEEIRLELKNVFADTDEDFASLRAVRSRLESWKASFSGQYDATFMGLSAPALFAPFIRRELINWDPLDDASPAFTKQHWYSLLFDYGAQSPESDPDHQVIPNLVTQLVLPWVASLATYVWDPINRIDPNHCRALRSVIADIMVHYDSGNNETYKPVSALLDTIASKLHNAVEVFAAETPSWMPSAVAATERAQECRDMLFERGTMLLSCICMFGEVLQRASVDALLEPLGKAILQLLRSCMASAHDCATMAIALCDAISRGGMCPTTRSALRSLLEPVREIVQALSQSKEKIVSEATAKLHSIASSM